MTDEQLSQLSLEDKLKVTQFLIADIASHLLSEDKAVIEKARHDIGAMAMTFTNMNQLIVKATQTGDLRVVKSIYNRYRYQDMVDSVDS